MPSLDTRAAIARTVRKIVANTPITDIHTHLYSPAFGKLLLWGLDELLTYHYLVSETFRQRPMPPAEFWALSKAARAELAWDELFIKHSPISESCRGALTCLRMLGLDARRRDLKKLRAWFAKQRVEKHVDAVLAKANVSAVVMTNNPFDDVERPVWLKPGRGGAAGSDPRFRAALRLDNLLIDWPKPAAAMAAWGYGVTPELSPATLSETRRFLGDWIERMNALYMAVSLSDDFFYPDSSARTRLLEEAALPAARERGIPLALMIGVRRQVNPGLRLAGDGVGRADNRALENLCRAHPRNRFLATYLSRENQHELCVTARKFANLTPFGCWWFMNNPSIIEEITRERLELLGLSFIPQHSDARVLEQLLYKWSHSRSIIADALAEKYADIAVGSAARAGVSGRANWIVTEADIKRDVADLFGGNFERFLRDTPKGA